MGTTLDALNTGNTNVAFVVVIEGCPYALTSGDPFATLDALQASSMPGLADAVDACGGLTVDWGGLSQTLDPWKPFSDAPTLRLVVAPSQSTSPELDLFGTFAAKRTGGDETVMADGAVSDCNDLTIVGRSSSAFDASGYVYVGPERIGYSSHAAGTFTISTRGVNSPFTTEDGDRFARTHQSTDPTAATGDPLGVRVPPAICSEPRAWIGRWVGVWILRNAGGVYDTPDQGHLAFAGTIANVGDDGNGRTVIELDHALTRVYETVLHRDQYTADFEEGCYLAAGQSFGAVTIRGAGTTVGLANALVVVSGSPASVNEIQAGRYNVQEIADAVDAWLRSEYTAARTIFHLQYIGMFSDPSGGIRARFDLQDATAGTNQRVAHLTWPDEKVAQFMGWGEESTISCSGASTNEGVISPQAPLRYQRRWSTDHQRVAITLVNPRGTWVSQASTLPVAIRGTSGLIDGVILVDGIGAFSVRYISDTSMEASPIAGGYFPKTIFPETLTVESDTTLTAKQVLILESSFASLLMQILTSTGTAAFNSANYDVLPESVGCALPYSILTSAFEDDLAALDNADKAACLFITKPTRFSDLFQADFALRWCAFVWGQGRLQIRGWTTPLAGYAETTLGIASSAVPSDTADNQRATSVEDLSAIYNVIKFQFGADGDGRLADELSILDKTSARDYGARALTIAARNAANRGPSSESIVELMASFSATMGLFSRPFYRVTRPLALPYFEQIAPMSVIAFTDPHVRNPETGQRGITAWPAVVIGQSIDWGGVESGVGGSPRVTPATGEVTLMLRPRIVSATYSPACMVDDTASGGSYSAGYSAATPGFKVYSSTFSDGDAAVDASYFAAGDWIRIIEIDPSVAGSPTTWTRQILSVSAPADIVLTAVLAAPAWDPAKKYIITAADYTTAQTSQRDKTFQADDADGLVANARQPYGLSVLGSSQDPTFTLASATTLPSRPPTMAYGDGIPLDVAYDFQAAELANNLISYKTGPMCPEVYSDIRTHSGATDYLLTDVVIVGVGEGRFPAPITRKLYVAPHFRSTDGNTATIRISLCKLWPQGDDLNGALIVEPNLSATFTTTSTTFVTATAQGIDTRHLNQVGFLGGVGFLCVELKKGATSNVEYDGLSICRLGPLESP